MVRLVWLEGILRVVGWVVLAIALGLLGDWLLALPTWVRWVLLVAYLGLGSWASLWFVIRPWRRVPAGDRLALHIERREPGLRSRLISAVQLSRSQGWSESEEGKAFIERLVAEADRAASTLDMRRLVPSDGWKRVARHVVPLLGGVGLALLVGGPTSGILLKRALGGEVSLPRKTRFVEVTGDRVMARGDDLAVSARVEGVIPRSGRLMVRHASGRVQTLVMDADGDAGGAGQFGRVLVNLTSSFRYRVRVNDAESDEFQVEVLPRPVVTNFDLTLSFPGYTRLEPRRVVPGELTLLRGSRLRLEGIVSQPLQRVGVRLEGLGSEVAAAVDDVRPDRFVVELPVEDARWTGFSVQLTDRRGIVSRDPAVYGVNVVEDQPPAVRVVLPARREELVTARGSVLISFEAKDDFGVAGLRLMHQPAASSTNEVSMAIELDLGGEATNVVRRRFEWRLAEVRPAVQEGAFLEFWVEARDYRELGGPGIGRSERYLARVVSEAEKRSDLLTRAGDAIGRLGDVAQGQERLNESLGRIILEKATPR